MLGSNSRLEANPLMGAQKSSIFTSNTKRRRINLLAIVLNIFAPWFLFCAVYAVMSFSFHYSHPTWAWIMVAMGGTCSLVLAVIALRQRRREKDPMWYAFAAVACFVAVLAGTIFGDMNFWYNMQPFYNINNLNTYPDIDPSSMSGQAIMDAGRVYFSAGTKLDTSKSMGFKNKDTYCVAPIVNTASGKSAGTYDFWAVGLNCCSTSSAQSFVCPGTGDSKARAGLRLMHEHQRPFMRLAVQQAEAHYGISAPHPLFFYWMSDPVSEMNAFSEDGFKYYLLGMFVHFGFNVFCVVGAIIGVSKFGGGN